jgi:purine-binding chemotaxis protein CheW
MTRARAARSAKLLSFVACEVGGARYVLPVGEVQEIVQPLELTALPHAPEGVIGAVEHREEVVPVLDLSARLGFGPTTSDKAKWVLLHASGQALGLVVGRVLEVFEIAESSLRPAPKVGDVSARASKSVLNYRGGMAFVLDTESLASLADLTLPGESSE